MKRQLVLLATLFASASVFGQVQQPATPQPTPATPPLTAGWTGEGNGIIGSGDLLQVRVFRTPDLDTQARVDNAGSISMPLIGTVHVAGLTADQAGKEISHIYAKENLIKNLDVTVLVTENESQRVSVLGEVKNPGSVALLPHMHLLDVISAAGGLDPTSSGIVSISHQSGAASRTYRVNGPLAGVENPEVEPGDTIQAEKAGIVYVVGAVNHAGGFVLESGKTVSLLQAMALAEGATKTAKLKQSLLIRTENGNRKIIPIDLNALLHNKGPDQVMEPDDVLFIPNSQVKEVARASGQVAMEMAAYAMIYHI